MIPLLKSALLPLLIAMAVGFILRKPAEEHTKDWVPALALFLAFAVGCWAVNGVGSITPKLSAEWLPYAALAGLMIATLIPHGQTGLRILIALLVVAAMLWNQLHPLYRPGNTDQVWTYAAIFAPLWLLIWFIWQWAFDEDGAPESLLLCVIGATAISLASALDGSVKVAQLAGALAAACGGLYLLKLKLKAFRIGIVFYTTFLAGLGAFLINTYVYVQANWPGVLLAYGAGLSALVTKLPAYRGASPLKRTIILCLSAGVFLIGVVVYLTVLIPDEYDPYGY